MSRAGHVLHSEEGVWAEASGPKETAAPWPPVPGADMR